MLFSVDWFQSLRNKDTWDFTRKATYSSFSLEVPSLIVCQMALLCTGMCQWHTFCSLWCVSIGSYSASIQSRVPEGYLKKINWSLQRSVPICLAITVLEGHSRRDPEALCPQCHSCRLLTRARLVSIWTVMQRMRLNKDEVTNLLRTADLTSFNVRLCRNKLENR